MSVANVRKGPPGPDRPDPGASGRHLQAGSTRELEVLRNGLRKIPAGRAGNKKILTGGAARRSGLASQPGDIAGEGRSFENMTVERGRDDQGPRGGGGGPVAPAAAGVPPYPQ